jgi:hypothetical protein
LTRETAGLKKKIRNKELFDLLKNLANLFMDTLDKPFVPEYGSWYDRVNTLVKGNTDLLAEILLKRPDLKNEKISKCLVNFDKCLKFIVRNESFSRKPPHASTKEKYEEEISFFLAKLFEEKDRLQREGFSTSEGIKRHLDRILDNEYLKYEAYLYDDSASDFLICPIENFVSPTKLDLGRQLSIREITQDEFHNLVSAEEKYVGRFPEYYSEIVIYVPIEGNPSERAELVVTSLRLLKKGEAGLTKVYRGYALPCRPWKVFNGPEESKFLRKPDDRLYVLSESESEKLVGLFSLLERTRGVGYLTVAIRRFNFAYNRDRFEDKWIDYFISLESLFSKSSEQTEVTHRISTRVSKALAITLEDKKEMRKKMKDWYGIRSKIVHGTKVALKPKEVREVEDVVRKSLKWFIKNKDYANPTKIIDDLDLGP